MLRAAELEPMIAELVVAVKANGGTIIDALRIRGARWILMTRGDDKRAVIRMFTDAFGAPADLVKKLDYIFDSNRIINDIGKKERQRAATVRRQRDRRRREEREALAAAHRPRCTSCGVVGELLDASGRCVSRSRCGRRSARDAIAAGVSASPVLRHADTTRHPETAGGVVAHATD
jgi:uncharacterized protein with von Willebrand factor type A (vWA) domain